MVFWIFDYLGTTGVYDVIPEDGVLIFDVRDIYDGENDSPEHPFQKVVDKLQLLIDVCDLTHASASGTKLAVRCQLGVSRSNSFAAALIAYKDGTSFEDGLEIVRSKVPICMPNMEIRDCLSKALEVLRKQDVE